MCAWTDGNDRLGQTHVSSDFDRWRCLCERKLTIERYKIRVHFTVLYLKVVMTAILQTTILDYFATTSTQLKSRCVLETDHSGSQPDNCFDPPHLFEVADMLFEGPLWVLWLPGPGPR